MAKAKKPTRKQTAVAAILRGVETYATCRVDCALCGWSESDRETTEDAFAERLYRRGWRYGTSRVYEVEGAFCPDCWPRRNNPEL